MSVKRNEFLAHLQNDNCYLHRNGAKHDIDQNNISKKKNYSSKTSASRQKSMQVNS